MNPNNMIHVNKLMWKKTPVQIMARFAPEYKLTGLKLQVILIM